MSAPSPRRTPLLAKIHLGQKALGWDRDTYEAVLLRLIGKPSCRKAGIRELEKVLAHMEEKGFKPRRSRPEGQPRPVAPRLSDDQRDKITALWLVLRDAGELRDPSPKALNSYVRRQTGVAAIAWLEPEQASEVIEALKKWARRVERKKAKEANG